MTNSSILPMPPFSWLQQEWEEFCSRLHKDTLPHAFLLAGKEGIGVGELAMAMSQFLLCVEPLKNIACGKCRGCQLLRADTHPDLLRVYPDEKGKAIKVDQIREITGFVDQTAQQGGFKIIILNPAEAMNVNASNALLKNLEEPAGKTVFFLVTHQLSQVLPTVRSRCAKISVSSPTEDESLQWLRSVGVENAEAVLYETGGAPILAKRWHEDGVIQDRFDVVNDMAKIAERRFEPMSFAKKWGNQDPMLVLEPMANCVDMALAERMAGKAGPGQYQTMLKGMSHCSVEFLFRLRDRLIEKKSQLIRSPNLNPALFIEELVLDWAAIIKGV